MRLVFIHEPGFPEPILVWNTLDTAESLRQQGLPVEAIAPRSHANVPAGDVFIFYRTMTTDSFTRMLQLQSQGKPCGFMIDDIVWDPKFEFAYAQNFENQCKRFFQHADFFVFTSEALAEVAAPLIPSGRNVFIRRPGILERRFYDLTRLSDRWREHRIPGTFRILINKGHITDDFKKLVRSTFAALSGELPYPTQVCYFSIEKIFENLGTGISSNQNLPTASFDRYMDQIATIAPDIIFCPFKPSEFNNCKCYPKYLESGGLAAPLLVSSIYPYRKVIRQGENGILAENEEELASLLLFAAKNQTWLRNMGIAAREDVRENHLLGPIALEFYERLKETYGNSA